MLCEIEMFGLGIQKETCYKDKSEKSIDANKSVIMNLHLKSIFI